MKPLQTNPHTPNFSDVEEFLHQYCGASNLLICDVRTPAEFEQGHIPGAVNVPIFTNEERAEVGTLYKQKSREEALLRGLDFVGPKMRTIIETVKTLTQSKTVGVYCWRGGMRSESVQWLLQLYGFSVWRVHGGYKRFRNFVLHEFTKERNLTILGGKTGSGKTHILHALSDLGEQVVDLEALAHHKGSAFGAIGELPPPTQEQFENTLAMELFFADSTKRLWLEDESRNVGKRTLSKEFWQFMQEAPCFALDVPLSMRLHILVDAYGNADTTDLEKSIHSITQRLGGLRAKNALAALHEGNLSKAAEICLEYYDRAYDYGLSNKKHVTAVSVKSQGEYQLDNVFQEVAQKLHQVGTI